jgi:hypothetical protein
MIAEEEKEELLEDTASLPNREGSPEEVNHSEEKSKDLSDEEQIEEEIVLDEVLAEEDEVPEADSQKDLKEEQPEERITSGENAGGPDASPPKGADKKGSFVFLRKKWALILGAGLLVLLGLGFSYGFLSGRQGKLLESDGLTKGQAKEERTLVETMLKPFFVPQPEDSENDAVKLVISVQWSRGTLIAYRKRAIRVRDEVYQYLLQAAGSGKNFTEKKSDLASELEGVLQHALAIKKIRVRVNEIAPI